VAADGEHNLAVRAAELGGDLLPARPGADDENAARRKRNGIPVAVRVQLQQVSRRGGGIRRDALVG
jgi:hypothetical protein